MQDDLTIAVRILAWAVPVLFAITLHEVAHAAVAFYLGDNTAHKMGRLTLNPFKHIDLLGSVVVPVLLLWSSGFIFGWAKPVPVNENNLNSPKRDMIFVAVAGPAANLVMSLLWALIMKLGFWMSVSFANIGMILVYMGAAGIFINTAIMMLNLLPLPPLDGGRILSGLLPEHFSQMLSRLEPWGFILLVALIISGLIAKIIWPLIVVEMAILTHLLDTPAELFINALRFLLDEPVR